MRGKALAGAALLASLAGTALLALTRDESGFPHREHAGLFPTCIGCHTGAITGNEAQLFPEPASCVGCHDGTDVERVTWTGPSVEPTNLRFSHVEHIREMGLSADSAALFCRTCHAAEGPAGDTLFMAVAEARPELCIDCHAHEAPAHLAAESSCQTCHVTLAQATALSGSDIEEFPEPPSHEEADFLRTHGEVGNLESCAFCHARESCARCHPNAASMQSIAALPTDARVARLVADRPGEFFVPASHRESDFLYDHGEMARAEIATCGNCHAQPSCRSCHIGTGARKVIAQLPKGDRGSAGVIIRTRPPEISQRESGLSPGVIRAAIAVPTDTSPQARDRLTRVHPPGFLTAHGADAAAGQLTCEGCHAKRFCSDCHDGTARRRFHPSNFTERHAAEAFGRDLDCGSCHNREAFCKSCHQSAGLASTGRRDVAFHTAQPLWLLNHGRAARQALESCASCHGQRDCLQCHSTIGRGVNPHGPGFNAERMADRNRGVCFACHVGDPLAP